MRPLGSIPAAFQSAFSRVWVPELSPRETKFAFALGDRLERASAPFRRANFGGIVLRTDDNKVVVHDEPTIKQLPSAAYFFSKLGA